jgi:hypothetical protein
VGGNYNKPSFPHFWTLQGKSFLDLFLYFFPMAWFMMVLKAKMSEAVQASGGDASLQPIMFGKMIQFLGIRLLMSWQQGWSVDDYWSYTNEPPDHESCPCPFNMWAYMSCHRFKWIQHFLTYMDARAPTFNK